MNAKQKCFQKYSERDPKQFVQIDCWISGDYIMGPDEAGNALTGGLTTELMHGSDARILIPPDAPPAAIVSLLRKAADWVERGAIESITSNCRDLLAPEPKAPPPPAIGGNVVRIEFGPKGGGAQ